MLREGEQKFSLLCSLSHRNLTSFSVFRVPKDSILEHGCSLPASLPALFLGCVALQLRQLRCPSLPCPSPSSWRCCQGVGVECSGLKVSGEEQKKANERQQPFQRNYITCFQGQYLSNGKTAHNAVNLFEHKHMESIVG